jgi:integrase
MRVISAPPVAVSTSRPDTWTCSALLSGNESGAYTFRAGIQEKAPCRFNVYAERYQRGIAWGGAHRLRHTTATHLIRNGASANQAQLWLGHHDPGFTARTYVHLDSDDLPDPAIFDSYFDSGGGNSGATRQAEAAQAAELRQASG